MQLLHQDLHLYAVLFQITSLQFPVLLEYGLNLQQELLHQFNIKIGEWVVLALDSGKGFTELPLLRRFKVAAAVEHGIYKKDLRFVYVTTSDLQKILNLNDKVNFVTFNAPPAITQVPLSSPLYIEKLSEFASLIQENVGMQYVVKPFWLEFSAVLEAVKIEKFSIGLILQLIVVIAIFNILSFLLFQFSPEYYCFFSSYSYFLITKI